MDAQSDVVFLSTESGERSIKRWRLRPDALANKSRSKVALTRY
jgi:hypothetical protein